MRRRSVVLTALAVALISAPAGLSHSGVRSTTPKAGSVVRALPATVAMIFGDRLLRVISVQVRDSTGRDHAVGARLNPRDAAMVLVRTRRPVAGRYTVTWKVQSEDGHSAAGTFTFRVRGS